MPVPTGARSLTGSMLEKVRLDAEFEDREITVSTSVCSTHEVKSLIEYKVEGESRWYEVTVKDLGTSKPKRRV